MTSAVVCREFTGVPIILLPSKLVFPLILAALVICVRVFAVPIFVNGNDSFTLMRRPIDFMGHWPPLYPAFSALLKARFGLSAAYLSWLLIVQYAFFGMSLVYFLTALKSKAAQLVMAGCVLLNFYALIIVGGIATEAISLPVLLLGLGAGLRMLSNAHSGKASIVFGLACSLAVVTRLPAVCLLLVVPTSLTLLNTVRLRKLDVKSLLRDTRVVQSLIATICGLVIGQLMFVSICKAFDRPCSSSLGRSGAIVLAKCWNSISESDRLSKLARYKGLFRNDPYALAIADTILSMPNSQSPWHNWTDIYEGTNKRLGSSGLKVSTSSLSDLKPIDDAASKLFWIELTHPDKYVVCLIASELWDHLQLSNLFLENQQYSWKKMEVLTFVAPSGLVMPVPKVPYLFLNRCLMNNSGLSERWGEPDPIFNRLFSEKSRAGMLSAINSKVLWLLDFVNPAWLFVLLVVMLSIGSISRRISKEAACLGSAVLLCVIAYDLFHSIFQAAVFSRYLALPSFVMGLTNGILLIEFLSREKRVSLNVEVHSDMDAPKPVLHLV